MKFVSNRDTVVRSCATGHAIEFKKGVPTDVPYAMRSEVVEKGILPVQDDGKAIEAGTVQVVAEPKKVVLPPEGEVRIEKIVEAFKAIVERNNPADFTGGGTPSASAVSTALQFRVDTKEVRGLWEKHRNALLNQPQV